MNCLRPGVPLAPMASEAVAAVTRSPSSPPLHPFCLRDPTPFISSFLGKAGVPEVERGISTPPWSTSSPTAMLGKLLISSQFCYLKKGEDLDAGYSTSPGHQEA